MSKMLSVLGLSLLLGSASAYATAKKDDARGLKSALDSAKGSLSVLKDKVLSTPDLQYSMTAKVDGELKLQIYGMIPGSAGNLYDKNILEKQLPYIEGYINLAAEQLGKAAEKLPSLEGDNLFSKGCANVQRAHRQLEIALDKSARGTVFTGTDFVDLESDIQSALSDNNCP